MKDHAKLKNKAFSLVFFCFFRSIAITKQQQELNYVNLAAVNPVIALVPAAASRRPFSRRRNPASIS
jgi:hypothetical protein